MEHLQQSIQWFKSQSKGLQRFLLFALIVFLLAGLFLSWLFKPSYGTLFNNLDNRDANVIVSQLEQNNIPYEIANNGEEILIDKRFIAKTRLKLMENDLHLSKSIGFELFDKSDFGMSDFTQKINYQRALQGELERTITSLAGVKSARVHLVIPERRLFHSEENRPRAAVTLHLLHPLSHLQIHSIQQLIAASVPFLQQKEVVLVDQQGNGLTNTIEENSSNHFKLKQNMERYLSRKVLTMLEQVFSKEEVQVKIDVSLNYDQLERELIKPQQEGMLTHEKEAQHSTSTTVGKAPTSQELTREKSYQFGSEKERYTRARGNIERLTISVVVPYSTQPQTIKQIERLVKSIIGFNSARGDSISVEPLIIRSKPFFLPSIAPLQKPVLQSKKPKWITFLGLSLLLPLFIIIWQFRNKKQAKRQILLLELKEWLHQNEV